MSDFLSNFDNNNYKKTVTEKKDNKEKNEHIETPETRSSKKKRSTSKNRSRDKETKGAIKEEIEAIDIADDGLEDKSYAEISEELAELLSSEAEEDHSTAEQLSRDEDSVMQIDEDNTKELGDNFAEEETEIDPTYKKRKQIKIIIFTIIGVILAILLFWTYYSMTHVVMPKFIGKTASVAREWSSDNKVKLDVKQEYDNEKEVNTIIKQSAKAGKKIKKKSVVKIVTSLGPNPDDVIALPDFSKLSKKAADEWVLQNKAENLSVIEEYSDKVEKNKFVRQEIKNKDITPETYRRKDQAIIYFSKGKEKFEKNITVPDFAKKPKSDVETWVKNNEIKMEYKAVDSDKIDEGLIISQSVAKGKKVAKRDAMSVEVSTGAAITVPNFGDLTPETAATVEGLTVTVKTVFSWDSPYGSLISQSIPAGEKVKASEAKVITVTYSEGKPYLRSYFGQLEGDLDKLFFEDYRSKGANIKYTTYYVNSAEERGKVVDMSAYNQYVPLEYTVSIAVSNGSGAEKPSEIDRSSEDPGEGTSDTKE